MKLQMSTAVAIGVRWGATMVALVTLNTTQSAGIAAASQDPSCAAVEVVFARGTNEAPGVGVVGQAFIDALNARLQTTPASVYAVDYPASYDFAAGAQGVVDATHQVESIAANCPNTKIILGGYSQGAAVAGYTVTDTIPPGFVLPEGITGPLPAAIPPTSPRSSCSAHQPGG